MEALGIQRLNMAQMSIFVTVAHRRRVDRQVPEAEGSSGRRVTANGHGVSFWGNENVVESDSADGFTTLGIDERPLNRLL